jgi:hypothetical protein
MNSTCCNSNSARLTTGFRAVDIAFADIIAHGYTVIHAGRQIHVVPGRCQAITTTHPAVQVCCCGLESDTCTSHGSQWHLSTCTQRHQLACKYLWLLDQPVPSPCTVASLASQSLLLLYSPSLNVPRVHLLFYLQVHGSERGLLSTGSTRPVLDEYRGGAVAGVVRRA